MLFEATKGNFKYSKSYFLWGFGKALEGSYLNSKQSSNTPRNSNHLRTPKDQSSQARLMLVSV